MVDYREILRLGSDPKNSQRRIELVLRCSRHTIRDVLFAAERHGISWPLDESVTNEMLREMLFPAKTAADVLYAAPDYALIHKELARSGVNLTLTKYFLTCGKEAEQGYKSCAGIVKLAERYGSERLEKACNYLLSFSNAPSLRTLTAILKNNYGQTEKKDIQPAKEKPKPKGITRGASYFKRGGNADD